MSNLIIEVTALDATHGYNVAVQIRVDGTPPTTINEHYGTETALRSRLATIFDAWAAQVDSE
jgi:hypothetical protein